MQAVCALCIHAMKWRNLPLTAAKFLARLAVQARGRNQRGISTVLQGLAGANGWVNLQCARVQQRSGVHACTALKAATFPFNLSLRQPVPSAHLSSSAAPDSIST